MIDTTKEDLGSLPIRRDIKRQVGDTETEIWALEYIVAGTPLTLAGVTWELIISTTRGGTLKVSGVGIPDLTGASGILVESVVDAQIKVWVKPSDTLTALGPGLWWYEIRATFPVAHPQLPSVVRTLWHGDYALFDKAVMP